MSLDNIDKAIATIRKSKITEIARQNLMSGFTLSKAQADAILNGVTVWQGWKERKFWTNWPRF